MRFGVLASLLFHGCLLGLAFLSLPEGLRPDVEAEPFVPIELIADAEFAERTSIPAAVKDPDPEPVAEPDLPEPEEIEPEVIAKAEAEPVEPEPEPLPIEQEVKQEPKKPEPKTEPKKPESNDLDLDNLAALVDKAKEEKPKAPIAPSETTERADEDRRAIGAGDRLAASDITKMRAAVSRCWNAGALVGAPEPEKLKVVVEFELNRDGSLVSNPRVKNGTQISLSGNRFWKVAEQNAVRAVVACQPYDFLQTDRYDAWKEMELNFDPSEMAGF